MAGNENNFPKKPGKPNVPLNPWNVARPLDEDPEPLVLGDADDDAIDFGTTSNVHEGASGIIPLADLPDPTSSASMISWAEVIRQQKESIFDDSQDSGLKVDSVSDTDLRRHMPTMNSFAVSVPPRIAEAIPMAEAVSADELGIMFSDDLDGVKTLPIAVFVDPRDPQDDVRTLPVSAAGKRPLDIPSAAPSGIFGIEQSDSGPNSGSAISFEVTRTPKMPKTVRPPDPLDIVEAHILGNPTADDIFLPNAENVTDSDQYIDANAFRSSGPNSDANFEAARGLLFASEDGGDASLNPEVRLDALGRIREPADDHSSVMDILLGDDNSPSMSSRLGDSDDAGIDFGNPADADIDNSNVLVGRYNSPTQPVIDLSIFEQAGMPIDEMALDTDELLNGFPSEKFLPPSLMNSLTSTSNLELPDFDSPLEPYNPEELVDLYSEGPASKGISDSGSLQVSQEELDAALRRQRMIESSAIDLGSHGSLVDMDTDLPPAQIQPDSGSIEMRGYDEDSALMRTLLHDDDDGGVDMGLMPPAKRPESQILGKDRLDERKRAQGPTSPKPRTPTPIPASDPFLPSSSWSTTPMLPSGQSSPTILPSQPRPTGGLVRGTVLGGLLTAGTFAGVYLSGAIPNSPLPTSTPIVKADTTPAKVAAVVASPTPADARKLLTMGEPQKALEALAKVENPDPATLSSRGQARWLNYLQTAAVADSPMKPDADTIAKAKGDLASAADKAKALGTAEGDLSAAQSILWQGLIEESLGNFDAASKLYSSATLTGDASEVLKAAANRLKLMAPAPGMPVSRMDPREALLGLTILLQADTPVKADTLTEAGFRFWDSLALAAAHDYPKAQAAIKEARKLHDTARLKKPGRGLNPLSDPLDQIFLRCCDDLSASWTLRESIYRQPGIAQIVARDGFKGGLDELLARSAKLSATLKSAGELLAAEKLDASDLSGAVRRLIDDRKTTEEATKAAIDLLKKEGYEDPKLEAAVAKLASARKLADERLKAVTLALKNAGSEGADAPKAIAMLAAAKTDLDATLKAVADRLREKKLLGTDATSAQMLESLTALLNRPAVPIVAGNVDTLLPPAQLLVGSGLGPTATLMGISKRVVDLSREVTEEKTKVEAAKKAEAEEKAKAKIAVEAQLEEKAKVEAALVAAAKELKAREEAVAAKKVVEAELAKAKTSAETAMEKLTGELTTMRKKSVEDLDAMKLDGDKARKEMLTSIAAMEAKIKVADAVLTDAKAREAKIRDEGEAKLVEAKASEDKLKTETAKMTGELASLRKQYDSAIKSLNERPTAPAAVALSDAIDPERGTRLFARGLQSFYRGDYSAAETDLREAIRSNGNDARYHYILGLCCWYQNRPNDSKEILLTARSLEVRGMPSRTDISMTLERIQGTPRTVLNLYRP